MANKLELIVYAATLELRREKPLETARWEQATVSFLNALAQACQERGVTVIGHIKGFLDLGQAGYLYLSTVSPTQGTSSQGLATGETPVCRLDLNLLVYGGKEEEIKELVAAQVTFLENVLAARCSIYETNQIVQRNVTIPSQ